MENNRRSLVATLGPWLGVILLLVVVSAGVNHLREAQEELAHIAKIEAVIGPLPAEADDEDSADAESADAESADETAEVDSEPSAESSEESAPASEEVVVDEAATDTEESADETAEVDSEPSSESSEESAPASEEVVVDEAATDTEESADETAEVDSEPSAESSEESAQASEEVVVDEAATEPVGDGEELPVVEPANKPAEPDTESSAEDAEDGAVASDEDAAVEDTTTSELVVEESSTDETQVETSGVVTESVEPTEGLTEDGSATQGMGPGGMARGMGGGNMRAFHMTPIPEEYAGMLSPIPADEESLARGEPIFLQNCATCHGETGLGDGPAAVALDPTPPMIAMTSQMLGDDYMFWRISEGGAFEPYNSAMPTWKASLDEDARWDVINFVRSLGKGLALEGGPGSGSGRSAELEEAMRAEMLAAGIEIGAVTQEEADLFDTVHAQIDLLRASDPDRQFVGTMRNLQDQLLEELVADDSVTREDADTFNTVLGLLEEAGLMQ